MLLSKQQTLIQPILIIKIKHMLWSDWSLRERESLVDTGPTVVCDSGWRLWVRINHIHLPAITGALGTGPVMEGSPWG
jgi:hypothetical protein